MGGRWVREWEGRWVREWEGMWMRGYSFLPRSKWPPPLAEVPHSQ